MPVGVFSANRDVYVPGSYPPDINNVDTTSNVGRPGVWIFRVDEPYITFDICSNYIGED